MCDHSIWAWYFYTATSFFSNSTTRLLKWKQLSPTHTQIDFQMRGKHGSLLRLVFSVSGFNTDQMAMLKPLMILEVPRCWVICLAPYHLQVGLYCWSGGPTMGPFPSALYLLIPLAHPSACTGSLFSLPALLRGLCSRESHNPSGLCVCTCFPLLCFSSCWGVFAEGTKWSQASCSNRLKEHVLCVWG